MQSVIDSFEPEGASHVPDMTQASPWDKPIDDFVKGIVQSTTNELVQEIKHFEKEMKKSV